MDARPNPPKNFLHDSCHFGTRLSLKGLQKNLQIKYQKYELLRANHYFLLASNIMIVKQRFNTTISFSKASYKSEYVLC